MSRLLWFLACVFCFSFCFLLFLRLGNHSCPIMEPGRESSILFLISLLLFVLLLLLGCVFNVKYSLNKKVLILRFQWKCCRNLPFLIEQKCATTKHKIVFFHSRAKFSFFSVFSGTKLASVNSIFRPVCCELDSLKIGFN